MEEQRWCQQEAVRQNTRLRALASGMKEQAAPRKLDRAEPQSKRRVQVVPGSTELVGEEPELKKKEQVVPGWMELAAPR